MESLPVCIEFVFICWQLLEAQPKIANFGLFSPFLPWGLRYSSLWDLNFPFFNFFYFYFLSTYSSSTQQCYSSPSPRTSSYSSSYSSVCGVWSSSSTIVPQLIKYPVRPSSHCWWAISIWLCAIPHTLPVSILLVMIARVFEEISTNFLHISIFYLVMYDKFRQQVENHRKDGVMRIWLGPLNAIFLLTNADSVGVSLSYIFGSFSMS